MTEIDVKAIARRALQETQATPSDVFTRALREAGVPGDYQSNREFCRLWHDCADEYKELAAAGQSSRPALSITAAQLWRAYDQGLSQTRLAQRLRVTVSLLGARSRDLGFVFEHKYLRAGPCLGCGVSTPLDELDAARHCARCAAPQAEVA